ncbi:ATP-grasp domain-containing protein, partial [Rhizobium sp. SEMIA 4085]
MPRRALVLVEGHKSNGPLYVRAAQRLGLHPITLSADPAQYDYLAAEGIEAIQVDTSNLDLLIHECTQLGATYGIVGITGFTGIEESPYVIVAKLCRYFNLPGPNPTSIERCCDKFAQRQFLAEAGVPIPAYRLASDTTEVKNSAAEIGLPVVVKPAEGSGSSGVRLCRDVEELD